MSLKLVIEDETREEALVNKSGTDLPFSMTGQNRSKAGSSRLPFR